MSQIRNTETIIAGMAADIGRQASDLFMEQFDNHSYDLEKWTPIERLMGYGILFNFEHMDHLYGNGGDNSFAICGFIPRYEELEINWGDGVLGYGTRVIPQLPVGPYTADFFIAVKAPRAKEIHGVIECDGHDYHERTKAQAAHDKKRDRYFQSKGLIVLRYTGSEIFRAPVKCAADAIKILTDLSKAK